MSFSNPTASTQGRGFEGVVCSHAGRMTRRMRATVTLAALAVASLGSVGCQNMPLANADGSTARLVAAVDASRTAAPGRVYDRPAGSTTDGVMLAEAR